MCGITGFCDFRKSSSLEQLEAMNEVLKHRGPDEGGEVMVESPHAQIGMAMRRLAILDLSPLGHQPMQFEQFTLIFNGEIYNFLEIRAVLEKEGYAFTSRTDTEVILKGFHCWGRAVVKRFIGMFSFVIFDVSTGEISIYRDRPGVKPLYYYWNDGLLLWSSELKSFHQHTGFKKEINEGSLALFLQYSYIPAPHCIFKDAYKLKPGHFLKIDLARKSITEHPYWDVFDFYNLGPIDISEKEAVDETERLLTSAYGYRMIADVPVGVFLSGGYDSASVAAILQKTQTGRINTFTIGFKEAAFNEAPAAKAIAQHLGTHHTEYYATAKDASDILPQLPIIYDEPFADNSTVPTVLVSKLASRDVKVVLSADGGDEIFGGYFKFLQAIDFTSRMPHWGQSALSNSMSMVNPKWIPFFNRRYNFATRFEKLKLIWKEQNPIYAQKIIAQYITASEVGQFLARPYEKLFTNFDAGKEINACGDDLNRLLAVDFKTFLPDNNLVKVDRATMSVSIEGREPMLDHRLIEFFARVPSRLKIKEGDKKHLLKEIVHRYIPKHLMDRPKMPFIAPLSLWFKDELKEQMLYYLSFEKLSASKLFNPRPIIQLRDAYLSGKKENMQKLWNLLVFQIWYEKWMN